MRTEDLIADLASRATPVRPLPSPAIRALGWLGIATAFVLAGLAIFGPRPGLDVLIPQPEFVWTAVLALATVMFAVLASLDARDSRRGAVSCLARRHGRHRRSLGDDPRVGDRPC